jgi:beta-lactam-binding protein with PASTA domain
VVNLSQAHAVAAPAADGLQTKIVDLRHGAVHHPARGTVLMQIPAAGPSTVKGSIVQLNAYLSRVVVPNVVGQTAPAAISILHGNGFSANYINGLVMTIGSQHIILSQSPVAGVTVAAQSTVTIIADD